MAYVKRNNEQEVNERKSGNDKTKEAGKEKFQSKPNRRGQSGTREPRPQHNTRGSNSGFVAQRVHDATALNFNYPVSNVLGYLNKAAYLDGNTINIPEVVDYNVFRVSYIATLGSSKAANLAAQKIFGEMRRTINVPTTYEAGDVFMYIQAVQSLAELIEHVKRVIRLANTYKTHNFMYPKALLSALKFDVDEVIDNGPRYREAVNKALMAMKYVAVPTVYESHAIRCTLNSSVFIDEESPKAQSILFTPDGFWRWNVAAGSSTNPSDLSYVQWAPRNIQTGMFSVVDVEYTLSSLLDAMLTDSDAQRIHGDILKCFGDGITLGGDVITESEYIEPVFAPYILYMLHNATIFHRRGTTAPTISWTIPTGSTSPSIEQHYYVDSAKTYSDMDILDMPIPEPDDDMVIDMMRWKAWSNCSMSDLAGTTAKYKANCEVGSATEQFFPLEILCGMEAIQYNVQSNIVTTSLLPTVCKSSVDGLEHISYSSVLRIRPVYYIKTNTASSGSATFVITHVIGDRGYCTIIDRDYALRLFVIAAELNYNLQLK